MTSEGASFRGSAFILTDLAWICENIRDSGEVAVCGDGGTARAANEWVAHVRDPSP